MNLFLKVISCLTVISSFLLQDAICQVAVNSDGSQPNTSAMLDVKSTTKGFLLPRMTTSQRTSVTGAVDGLMVYDTDVKDIFLYRNGAWSQSLSSASGWQLTGNSGTTAGTNFIGTTDNVPLTFKVNNMPSGKIDFTQANTSYGYGSSYTNSSGISNTATGAYALYFNESGSFNTATGRDALNQNNGNNNTAHGYLALQSNSTGYNNTASGSNTLKNNTSGSKNTAIGAYALYTQSYSPGMAWESENVAVGYFALGLNQPVSLVTGVKNTAVGALALFSNSQGYYNSALGYMALNSNTLGYHNSAFGYQALYSNTYGYYNTATGYQALYSNTEGIYNIANGYKALISNTKGCYNTAIGDYALYSQSYDPGYNWNSYNVGVGYNSLFDNQPTSTANGIYNTGVGAYTLSENTTGASNTAMGYNALKNSNSGWQNTSFGANSLVVNTIGGYNTAVGYNTGPNGNNLENTTCLGIDATATASNTVRIGNGYVTSIGGYQNWSNISDGRFKEEVEENVPGLSFITQLRPVTYRLDREKINEFTGVNERRKKIGLSEQEGEYSDRDRYSAVTTGFIAQEVEKAAKNAGFNFSGVDAPKNSNDLYGLRYAEFVVPLVKAMQEQQATIDDLKLQNAGLLKRIEALEKK